MDTDTIGTLIERHFSIRQRRILTACMAYVEGGAPGLPGHHLMLIISGLYKLLVKTIEETLRPDRIRFAQRLYNGQAVTVIENPLPDADLCLHCTELHGIPAAGRCAIVEAQEAFCRMVGLKVAVRQCPDFREAK